MSDESKNKLTPHNKSLQTKNKTTYSSELISKISKIQSLPDNVVIDFLNSQGSSKKMSQNE